MHTLIRTHAQYQAECVKCHLPMPDGVSKTRETEGHWQAGHGKGGRVESEGARRRKEAMKRRRREQTDPHADPATSLLVACQPAAGAENFGLVGAGAGEIAGR